MERDSQTKAWHDVGVPTPSSQLLQLLVHMTLLPQGPQHTGSSLFVSNSKLWGKKLTGSAQHLKSVTRFWPVGMCLSNDFMGVSSSHSPHPLPCIQLQGQLQCEQPVRPQQEDTLSEIPSRSARAREGLREGEARRLAGARRGLEERPTQAQSSP